MKELGDRVPLSTVNLFGTHDSLTAFVNMENMSRCQNMTLEKQLEIGVRLLDIRLSRKSGEFYLVHSLADCFSDESKKERLCFGDVLRVCTDFLKENPDELIVMSVKQDRGIQNRFFFPAFYGKYIKGNEDKWCLSDKIPTVGECRGKIVLMRRCKVFKRWAEKNPCGLNFSFWKDQGSKRSEKIYPVVLNGSQKALVQDRYGLSPERKWNRCAKPFLDKADPDKNNICVHFISTAFRYKNETLVRTAEEMNGYFKEYGLKGSKGWFFFDFPDEEIALKMKESGEFYGKKGQTLYNK